MGMTIDDVIRYFKDMKKACCCGTEQATIAIDTMRKYQKIEEAYKKYLNDMVTNIYADVKFIKVLKEVLEDGKID